MVQTITNQPGMTPENFCYWLQGLFELQPDLKKLTPDQVAMIKQHLGYVFNRVQVSVVTEMGPVVDSSKLKHQIPITPQFPQSSLSKVIESGELPIATIC